MILECVGCRKMYRVRDDSAANAQSCPACGANLKVSTSSTQSLPSPIRLKELEDRVKTLERELQEARAASGAPTLSQAVAGFGFGEAASSDRQLLDLKSDFERKLAEKDRELAQAREAAARADAERRGIETRLRGLEQSQGKALEEKQKTLDALDASLASYREKLDAAQKKLEAHEGAAVGAQSLFEERLREREEALRAESERAAEEHRRALAELRSELERQIEEKDRQISENREVLDREAGERRRLGETVTRLQEALDRTTAEKDQAIASLKGSVAAHKDKAEALRKRLADVEELRKTDLENYASKMRDRDGVQARLAEAGHLASDLDQSLDSVADLLRGLRDRVRRLKGNLGDTPSAAPASEPAPEVESDLIEEPAPVPPAALPEPEPEPEAAPALIEETKVEEFSGRIEAPSAINLPVIREEAPPAVEEAREDVVEEAPKADAGGDLPLISPPEEESAPAPEAPKAPAPAEGRRVTRFSWKRS